VRTLAETYKAALDEVEGVEATIYQVSSSSIPSERA
jgi:hypothetical protein